jgi:hypothetical protein
MSQDTTRCYTIPAHNEAELQKRLNLMGRRAAKLGLPAPTATQTAVEFRPVRKNGKPVLTSSGEAVTSKWLTFEVSAAIVKLAGWTFLGTVEHTPHGNILRATPAGGDLDLTKFRKDKPTCDHCNTNRQRKDTYLVLHETGEIRRVGKSCIQAFLGKDALSSLTYEIQLDDLDELEEFGGFGRCTPFYGIGDVLSTTATTIRRLGWVPRSKADEGSWATADVVCMCLANPEAARRAGLGPILDDYTDNDTKTASKALEWARSIDEDTPNDYLSNLRVSCMADDIEGRGFGIVCSAVSAYNREISREAQRKAEREATADSKHLGNIGDRINAKKLPKKDRDAGKSAIPPFEATITRCYAFESDFGVRTHLKFCTPEGNVLGWWAAGDYDYAVGDKVWISGGTVKKHGEYQGVLETTLNRVKLLKRELVDA